MAFALFMQLPSRNWWLGNEFFYACYSYLSICLSIYLSIYLYAHIPYSRTIWQEQKQTHNYGGVRIEGVKVWKGAVHNALIDSNKYRYTYLKQTSLIAQFCFRKCKGEARRGRGRIESLLRIVDKGVNEPMSIREYFCYTKLCGIVCFSYDSYAHANICSVHSWMHSWIHTHLVSRMTSV